MEQTAIAKRISDRRKALGLTQEQLGERLGVTGQAVSKWETASALPDVLMMPALCRALHLSLNELYGVEPDETRETSAASWSWIGGLKERERTYAVAETGMRMFSRSGESIPTSGIYVSLSPADLLVADTDGMCFSLAGEETLKKILNLDAEKAARFFQALTDPDNIRLLRCMGGGRASDLDELSEQTGINRERIRSLLLDLVERNLAGWDDDGKGRTGWCLSAGCIAFFMSMAGLCVSGFTGSTPGCQCWFTRLDRPDHFVP